MKRCVIFCAGGFDRLAVPLTAEDFLFAADGGYRHTAALGITPHAVLGDFDSLGFVPENAAVFPVEKDDTDAMLAIRHGLSIGFREFLLYGSLDGERLDHTVANLQALRFLEEQGAHGALVGLRQTAVVIRNGSLSFPAGCKGYLSVFCMGSDAWGVTVRGLKYTLEQASLTGSFPLGVSNQFTAEAAVISVKQGDLLVIFDRENGLPERGKALC